VEVIVEAMVMGEVVVVVVMPIPMPVVSMPSTATIPGDVTTTIPRNVTTTTPAATTPVSTSDMASMPTAAANVGAAHATEVCNAGTTHASTEVAAAHSSEVASTASTVSGVCLAHYDRGQKHAARKRNDCNNTLSHDYISLGTLKREPVRRLVMSLTQ